MAEGFVRLVIDDDAVVELFQSREVLDTLVDIAERQVIPAAQQGAPKLTGEGAESIGWEFVNPSGTNPVSIRISWDKAHFYMYFHERGAKHLPARPFLVPALLGAQ